MALLQFTFWNVSTLPITHLLGAKLLSCATTNTNIVPLENMLSSASSDLDDIKSYLTLLAKVITMQRGAQGISTVFLVREVAKCNLFLLTLD